MLYISGSPRSEEIKSFLIENISEAKRSLLEDEEIAIVIGGDGFFFEMIKTLPEGTKFLPLNGGSLGYTLNDVEDLHKTLELIENRNWKEYFFPKFSCYFRTDKRDILLGEGANDLYLERKSGQAARINFKIDKVQMLQEPVICDGVIISTALGSTGYGLSAGGPIVHPAMQTFGITFSNAHYPRIPPIMVPGDCEVVLSVEEECKRPVRVMCDGRELNWKAKTNRTMISEIVVKFSEDKKVSVFYLNGHCRTSQLAKKIIRR